MTSHNQLSRKSKSHLQKALLSGIISPSGATRLAKSHSRISFSRFSPGVKFTFGFCGRPERSPSSLIIVWWWCFSRSFRLLYLLPFPRAAASNHLFACEHNRSAAVRDWLLLCLKILRELFGIVLPQLNMCCLRCLLNGCFFKSSFQVAENYFGFKLD